MGARRAAESSSTDCALLKGRVWQLEIGSRSSVHQREHFLKFNQGALRPVKLGSFTFFFSLVRCR